MRRPKACTACRSRRRKCVLPADHGKCDYCTVNAIECVLELPKGGWYEQRANRRKVFDSVSAPQPDASPSAAIHVEHYTTPLPDMSVVLEIVDLYFDYIHDQFHSLFHRPSFVEDVRHRQIPEPILFGVLSLGARFSNNPIYAGLEPRERGRQYFEVAEKDFTLRDTSLQNIQLGVLLGAFASGEGDAATENLFYSVSCRMAQVLDLPHRPASSTLEKEINLRVWWSLCMVDVWSSASMRLCRLLPLDGAGAALPMDDLHFLHLRREDEGAASIEYIPERKSPLIRTMIQLNRILLDVNDFNTQCVANPPSRLAVKEGIEELAQRLDSWLDELPPDVHDTADNFRWYNAHGLGRIFAAVYLGYYHFGQMLYYQFLHTGNGVLEEPAVSDYSDRCKWHSAQLCDMVYRAVLTPGSDVRYSMVAHVLVIASTVQIHTLLFSEDDCQIRDARQRLEKNFEILLLLRPYWPFLDRVMSRLKAFHDTCQTNTSSSFVFDRWMLQFLVAFGSFMNEKPALPNTQDVESIYKLESLFVD